MRWIFVGAVVLFLGFSIYVSGWIMNKATLSLTDFSEDVSISSEVFPETQVPNPILFPSFSPKCSIEITDLADSRLIQYYDKIGVVDFADTGRKVTRAEFLKLLLNTAGRDVSMEGDPKYLDVSSTHTLKKYIAYSARNNVISGQDTRFRPDEPISRAEVAKILVQSAGLSPVLTMSTFVDVDPENALSGYVEQAFESCILHGRQTVGGAPIGTGRIFEPYDGITLAEAIKALYNMNQ